MFAKINVCIVLLLLFTSGTKGYSKPVEQEMYWVRDSGSERNEYVFFRKELPLSHSQIEGTIHIYADSRYALYVNGTCLGYGPARSYHKHPYYDTYNLAPFLKKGENILAVKAFSNGISTFRLHDFYGGIAVWGFIKEGNATIDLGIQTWLCRKAEGYDQSSPRFNFATGPVEDWDTRKDVNWNLGGQTLQGWGKPVRIKNQQKWGDFLERTIPPLTQSDVSITRVTGAYKLSDREDLYSFRIATPDSSIEQYQKEKQEAIVYTYLYSPEDAEVDGATWWGTFFLNGEPLTGKEKQPHPTYRVEHVFKLKKGWNLLVGKCRVVWSNLDFYLALPRGRGLEVSAVRRVGSDELFYSIGPFQDEKQAEILNIPDFPKGFPDKKTSRYQRVQKRSNQMQNPARDIVWKEPNPDAPIPYTETMSEALQIPVTSDGVTYYFDLGEMQLGRIYLEGQFQDGVVLDIGYTEELDSTGVPWVYKNYHIGPGMRFVTSEEITRYESFHPYGVRFLRVNVRGNTSVATIRKVGVVRMVYPFETIGRFKSSDEILNRLWDAGWRTLQLCAEDSYTDTPYRERTLYAGDMLPETAITLSVAGDLRLTAHCLNIFQDVYYNVMHEGHEGGEFPLLTLLSLDWYTTYTGDRSLAEKYYHNYKQMLLSRLHKKDNRGLIPEQGVYIEWSQIAKPEVSTPYQAVVVKALRILSAFAEKSGKTEEAAFFAREADSISACIRKYCWDDERKAFSDGYDQEGKLVDSYFLSSGVWPALFGIATEEQTRYVIEKAKRELVNMDTNAKKRKISAYSSFYLISLLYNQGEEAFAEWYMRKYWTPMVLHAAKPTTWEFFDTAAPGTLSHAWSGHPTYFMASEALGVNLGFHKPLDRNKIVIAPCSETLQWAEGCVTHPAGKVHIRWQITGENLFVYYDGPRDIPFEIRPKGRLAKYKLWINNHPDPS
jgi:hypothetical protein